MNTQVVPTNNDDPSDKKGAYAVYILYLLSLFIPLLPIVAVIIAYIFFDEKSNLKSHFQYSIRTFWIGLLYFSISSLLILVLIGFILVPLCILWLIIRNVKGLKFLSRGEPIPYPKTWIF